MLKVLGSNPTQGNKKITTFVCYRNYLDYHFPQLKGCVSVNKHIASGRAGTFAVAAA